MADNNPALNADARSRGSRNLAPVLIVALLMLVEGVAVFYLAKALTPSSAAASEPGRLWPTGSRQNAPADQFTEVELAECRPSNMTSGRLVLFHIRVSALVAREDADRAQALVRNKRARLEDAVNTVIRSAQPRDLSEPILDTIKRRLHQAVNQILEDDQLIREILIPQLLQSGHGL